MAWLYQAFSAGPPEARAPHNPSARAPYQNAPADRKQPGSASSPHISWILDESAAMETTIQSMCGLAVLVLAFNSVAAPGPAPAKPAEPAKGVRFPPWRAWRLCVRIGRHDEHKPPAPLISRGSRIGSTIPRPIRRGSPPVKAGPGFGRSSRTGRATDCR